MALIAAALVIPAATLTWIVGALLPFITAVVTHVNASNAVKNYTAVAVAVIAGVIEQLHLNGADAIITWQTLPVIGTLIVTQFAIYNTVYKTARANERVLPQVGIGNKVAAAPGDC